MNETKGLESLAKFLNEVRAKPIREFDQIYMKTEDMINQAKLTMPILKGKRVLFLGDGDGMSILLTKLFETENNENLPREISVFDFDERILNKYLQVFNSTSLKDTIEFNCIKYNVVNPIPMNFKNNFDFFYINPPYGSLNKGNSCIVWLYRCIELCKTDCTGCMIVPCNDKFEWTLNNTYNIQKFLNEYGFIINRLFDNLHEYNLDDNPNLLSSSFYLKRVVNLGDNLYANKRMPLSQIKNLYGSERKIPEYIEDDGTDFGKRNYDWEYGSILV